MSILHNKKFVNQQNTANGEVSGSTVFYYKQVGETIEATYSGGSIRQGHLLGVMTSVDTFSMVYHHVNQLDELRIGQCNSTIILDENGKIKLLEHWQWLNGDCSTGESVLVEI